jgi:hypothetical protein
MLDSEFMQELTKLINMYSLENMSNTPDFILANYIKGCLENFSETVTAREKWYGRGPKPIDENASILTKDGRLDFRTLFDQMSEEEKEQSNKFAEEFCKMYFSK